MFLRVRERLIGLVVMDRSVVFMMVMDTLVVFELVPKRRCVADRRHAALHGKAIQRQTQQQEDVDNPTQRNHQVGFARL